MPVLAKFTLTTPILDTACRRGGATTLRADGQYVFEGGEFGWRVWVDTADIGGFEAGLDADETVTSHDRLGADGSRHLYKVRLSEAGRRASILPLLGECGGEFVGGKRTESGCTIRLRFPSSATLREFSDACESRETESVTVESIHQETTCDTPTFGVTPSQREALHVALEEGYFDIPRGTTLSDLAADLGVSDQAVSERLRRAQKRVFEQMLVADER